jgi:gas vesicle protein
MKAMSENKAEQAENGSGVFAWFLVGVAIGAVVGILYAPKSGKETRDAITGTSRDVFEAGKDVYEKSRQVVDDAASLFERGRKLVGGDRPARG